MLIVWLCNIHDENLSAVLTLFSRYIPSVIRLAQFGQCSQLYIAHDYDLTFILTLILSHHKHVLHSFSIICFLFVDEKTWPKYWRFFHHSFRCLFQGHHFKDAVSNYEKCSFHFLQLENHIHAKSAEISELYRIESKIFARFARNWTTFPLFYWCESVKYLIFICLALRLLLVRHWICQTAHEQRYWYFVLISKQIVLVK